MSAYQLGLALLGLAGVALGLLGAAAWRRRHLQGAVREQAFQPAWRAILARRMPLYSRMPPDMRERLERATLDFLSRVALVGCDGLEITPEMRIVIGAHAALLALSRGIALYGPLQAVLVYPEEFVVPISEEDDAGVVTEGEDVLAGQAIETDRIVLSWADVIAPQPGEGAWNVVLHEFAHFIDESFGGALSARPADGASSNAWHDVLETEYERLCAAVQTGEDSLIDPYGAESPAEFFATATEAFFVSPAELAARNAPLYRLLADFYGLDPAAWPEATDVLTTLAGRNSN